MGIAIFIDNVSFSGSGRVTLKHTTDAERITIFVAATGMTDVQLKAGYYPRNVANPGITWSIDSGGAYASIDQNGKMSINEGVYNMPVIARATLTDDATIFVTKKIYVSYVYTDDTIIQFADSNVKSIILSLPQFAGKTDITIGEAKAYNGNWGNAFRIATQGELFNEFRFFINSQGGFFGSTHITTLSLPPTWTEIKSTLLQQMSVLSSLNPGNATIIKQQALYKDYALTSMDFSKIEEIEYRGIAATGLTEIHLSSVFRKMADSATDMRDANTQNSLVRFIIDQGEQDLVFEGQNLMGCKALKVADFPSNTKSLGVGLGYVATANYTDYIFRSATPPTWDAGANGFRSNPKGIYVPDASVNAYKSAAIWSNKASYIHPISEYVPSI